VFKPRTVSDSSDQSEVRECAFCDRVWGLMGVSIGLFLVFTGVDLMINGKLSARMRKEISPDDLPEELDDTAEALTDDSADEIEDEDDD
jgi:hypothetical protein